MSLDELMALARRHVVAVVIVLMFAAGTAFSFKHTTPLYQESATFVLKAPGSAPYSTFGTTLIKTGEVAAAYTMGVQGRQQARQQGVTGGFSVALVNYANQEFPYYGAPYLTVYASAHDPVTAHRDFTVVQQIFDGYLAARQVGISPDSRIAVSVVGDSGPLIQKGSTVRSFAGLLVLTLVIVLLLARFLDRHPVRLRGRLGLRPSTSQPAAASRPVR